MAGVSPGTAFSGSWTYDDGLVDLEPDLSFGVYTPFVSFTLSVAGTTFTYTSLGEGKIVVTNDVATPGPSDEYRSFSQNDGNGIEILLNSRDLTWLSSDALPLTPLDLSILSRNAVFINSANLNPRFGLLGTSPLSP